jgi:hypothetical protein
MMSFFQLPLSDSWRGLAELPQALKIKRDAIKITTAVILLLD